MMDEHGFLPKGTKCRACGAELQSMGSGRPAEMYAGTFTGLCYPCTDRHAFPVRRFADGAVEWSHPPHCPSWRRDREFYFAYADCTECKGQGRKWVGRGDAHGGSYTVHCPPCFKRYLAQSKRLMYEARSMLVHKWRTIKSGAFEKKFPKKKQGSSAAIAERDRLLVKFERFQRRVDRWCAWYASRNAGVIRGVEVKP